ncbi:MAG: NAD-dependent epimerase/dehydratase family protein [Eubacteriales bacterium]|nr:NAD-dependent epimerase/dehydratase family protein [Eubacteriales bacterium]
MKVLFIGGTGTISMAISKKLLSEGHELYLLNRGNRQKELPEGAVSLTADIHDADRAREILEGHHFDVAADFIGYTQEDMERDYNLLYGKTDQYIFISSAAAYKKPYTNYPITEGTPLYNPSWKYAQNKTLCEEYLMKKYRENGYPVTIVRPSQTYDERRIPFGIQGDAGCWQIIKRMKEGKPVLIPGDGTALWTVTHSSDFAKGFVGLMGNKHAIGEAVQITSDEILTWNQIYDLTAEALGVKLNPVHVASDFWAECTDFDYNAGLLGDRRYSVVLKNDKLKQLVPDFVATKRFDQAVKENVAFLESHPEYQVEDPEFDRFCDKVLEGLEKAKAYIRCGMTPASIGGE